MSCEGFWNSFSISAAVLPVSACFGAAVGIPAAAPVGPDSFGAVSGIATLFPVVFAPQATNSIRIITAIISSFFISYSLLFVVFKDFGFVVEN